MSPLPAETHSCPGKGCTRVVSNSILACPPCWAMLTRGTQNAIRRTARLSILSPQRRAALAKARAEWAAL